MEYGFQKIFAWQKAHEFVLSVYCVTKRFPEDEKFGLTSQLRRAAISITANIAEGYRRIGKTEKLRFFNISQGSLEECRNYILLARDLEYVNQEEFNQLATQIENTSKLLNFYSQAVADNVAMKSND